MLYQNQMKMKNSTKAIRKQIFQNQIYRLAKIYLSKPVSVENIDFHFRVSHLQVEAIKNKKSVK